MSYNDIPEIVEAIHAADDNEARTIEQSLLIDTDNRPRAGDPLQPEEES